MTDLYEDLGVHPEADTAAIKRARNKVAKEHHPDKGGDPDKFAKAQRAYLILADPAKRAKYDKGEDVSEGPNSDTADIAQLVINAFDQAMNRFADIGHIHIISKAKEHVQGEMGKLKQAQVQIGQAITALEKAIKRLKFKGDKPDIITRVMQDKIDGNKRARVANEHTLELMNAALAYLIDYDWEVDTSPVNQGYGSSINDMINQQVYRRPTDYKNY